MARKSRKVDYVNVGNKENLVTEAENQCEKVSHAALYARLSYESEKNRERNTIETQMVLLHNFVKEQKDIVVAKEYYDISKTGTNFERDGFNEMMQEIKEGNIDCVIVKDLSRLGRNYVEAGSYIERVFPFFNVRFISVNDHYDSFRDDISLLISMSNVYNEFYSRDLAKKIRSSYRTSWANGEFPSGQMAYGYEKDKDNPHQLIPDPVAAPVVKKIFQYFIDGMTYAEIAQLDAGSSFNKKFRGEKIPTLDEVLKFCRGKLDLNIEIDAVIHIQEICKHPVCKLRCQDLQIRDSPDSISHLERISVSEYKTGRCHIIFGIESCTDHGTIIKLEVCHVIWIESLI